MGLFDRFKKDKAKEEKPKEEKVIPDDLEIDADQLILKEIATNSRTAMKGRPPLTRTPISMLHWTCQRP